MKKTKLTRSLLAACSIVALSVVLSGCLHSGGSPPDTDGDSVADADDAFPNDPNETADSDGDGVGDNADAFPDDPDESADSDGDGVGDNADAFPDDPAESVDADGDGIGDNADPHIVADDRDNDGRPDAYDAFPDDPSETDDADGDGVGNNADAFPLDPMETADSDGDGVGDNADAFPMDAAETMDTDGDGVGDNADAFPDDPDETADSDGDGVGDNAQAVAEANAVVETKETAIEAEAAQTTDAGLGGTGATVAPSATAATGDYSLDIERDRDGTTITVTVHAANEDDDVTFMMNDMGMLVREMDADDDGNIVREIAMVATDIEAPEAVAFAMWQAMDGTTPQELNVNTDTTNDTPAVTNEALSIVAGNLGMISASAFTAPAGTTGTTVLSFQRAVPDDTSTTDVDETVAAAEIAGTFNGAMGTYRCVATGANCTVTVNTAGVVSAVSTDGEWAFIPAEGATSDQPDYDYLHYGFWLQQTEDSDGAITYNEIETFAGSSVDASGDVGSVTGSATYSGDALGVYVRDVFDSQGSIDTRSSGHFTADASLTATFGQVNDDNGVGTIAPNMLNTLTGTINNFDLSGGEANEWAVNLQGAITASAGTAAGTASGGVDGMDGSFSATFHGPVAAVDTVIPHPHTVVGEFNADFSNGAVAGAFGARQDD